VFTPVREIDAPSGPDMNAKFEDPVAYRFDVAKQSSFKPLDPSDYNSSNRHVCQTVEPSGELREWLDDEHKQTVSDRLQFVKPRYRKSRTAADS
jgi:hypothetical protein